MATQAEYLEQLPPEMKLRIFTELSSINDLRSLVLCGPALYRAVFADESKVCGHVLRNQIGACAFRDTICAFQARERSPKEWTAETQREFVDRYASLEVHELLSDCSLSKAVRISRLHDTAQHFTCDYARQALHNGPKRYEQHQSTESPPSEHELCRIERAFCRLELHCCLFSNFELENSDDEEHRRSIFWGRFAP